MKETVIRVRTITREELKEVIPIIQKEFPFVKSQDDAVLYLLRFYKEIKQVESGKVEESSPQSQTK